MFALADLAGLWVPPAGCPPASSWGGEIIISLAQRPTSLGCLSSIIRGSPCLQILPSGPATPPCRVLLKPVAAVCEVPEVRAGWCRALRPAERRWRVQGPALCSLC